ncbi:MAG: hypothetical protein MUD14_00350 [Hydrococcus sp. Prado102]|nr:hypothetical protein [Hydrococcus sp. Prado102]
MTASIDPDKKNSAILPTSVQTRNFASLQRIPTSPSPLLPRQAWRSQLAYLKAILKAKQALDRSEKLDSKEI